MVAPTDQFPAIYEKAIRKYREITDETLAVDFLTKIRNVEDLTKEIDERNGAFRQFRDKRGAVFNVLTSALIPVQLFGDLAAGGASMAFPPSSLVFGAVAYLIGAAKGVSASYDAIQDLMQMLQDFTIRLKVYTKEDISEALGDKLSDIIVTLIEIFALSTKTIRRGRLLKFTRNILLGSDDAIQAAMGRLDKLTQVEAHLVGAETLTESKRTGRVVDGISATVDATNVTVMETGMTVHQMSVQVQEVQEMLGKLVVPTREQKQAPEDVEALQGLVYQVLQPSRIDSAQDWFDKIDKARIPGTGDWVRNEDVFQSWINREPPIIFVSGSPGAGKSFLAANMVSYLQEQFPQGVQQSSPISSGYFFFKDDNPQTRSFHQALRDLAFQISKSDPAYLKYLSTIEEYEQISTLESAWRLLFVEYFLKNANTNSTAYIVLDAVDEALDEEREILIGLAKDLYTNKSRLQLVIVGRPYITDQLLEGLEVRVPTIHVTKQKNSSDIHEYIQASMKKSMVLRRVSAKLRNEIVDRLSAGADGMFLWVNLMLQELVKKRNESSIRKALDQAPRGLKEMLRHVLVNFSESSEEEELEYLNELLLWVTCANQPWRLAELEAILKLKSPEGDGMIDLEGALRRQWASFFTLQREDGLTTAELENGSANLGTLGWSDDEEKPGVDETSEDGDYFVDFNSNPKTTTITFCHASIGDFFRDDAEGKVSAREGHIAVGVNYHEAKAHILKTYLRLITDSEFAAKADDSGHMLGEGTRYWGRHLLTTSPSECSLEDKREIAKMLLTLFRSEESLASWLGDYDWAFSADAIKVVRQWWQEQAVLECLSPEEKEFILMTEDNPVTLFQPLITLCIKGWLREDETSPLPMVTIVWRYQMLVKGEVHDPERYMTAEDVIEAAGFDGSEKTSQWFRQCAIALWQTGYSEEALQYCTKAMELNPDDWRTLRQIAETYKDQEDWQKSIEHWERTRQRLSGMIAESPEDESLEAHLHECLERMGEVYGYLGDGEKRFNAFQEAYKHAPSCWMCIYAHLEHYHKTQAHDAAMELLKKLADTPVPEEDCSELTRFLLHNVFDVDPKCRFAAEAASATNDLDFVLESLRAAAQTARKSSRTLIAAEVDMAQARIYNESVGDHAKAIRCWEKIMDVYAASADDTLIGMIRQLASSNLAREFLHIAVEAGAATPKAQEAVAKLENLTGQSESSPAGSCSFVPAAYLGLYYHIGGQGERARALFRPLVQGASQTLGDTYILDEMSDLPDLRDTLVRAGDYKNAVAIAHRLEQDNSDPWYVCCGPCGQRAPTCDGFALCPICLDGKFCAKCVKLVGEGATSRKRCNSKHVEYFTSVPAQLKEIQSGMMLVDGEEIEFKTWQNQLRKEWGLDSSNASTSTTGRFGFGAFALGLVA